MRKRELFGGKKLLILFLVLTLAAFVFVGCSGGTEEPDDDPTPDGAAVKLGLGSISKIGKSKDMDGDKSAVAQVDTIMAAVSFDKDGKVVSVSIDNAQTKVEFDKDMQVASDKTAEYKTKVEKGDEYGMKKASSIGKEWYEQIAELEKWMVGKTVAEIKAMDVVQRDDTHPSVPNVPELTSLVTITVEDYIAVVEKAYANAIDVAGSEKLGLGHVISIGKSKEFLAQVDTFMAATAFDKDGKVTGTLIDNSQVKVEYNAEGKVTSDKTAEYKTKVEKGDEYGMKKASSIGKEWYEQIAELEKWMAGKTVAEIKAMDVVQRDDTHPSVPNVPELTSLVTITVESYIAAVEEAFANAK